MWMLLYCLIRRYCSNKTDGMRVMMRMMIMITIRITIMAEKLMIMMK